MLQNYYYTGNDKKNYMCQLTILQTDEKKIYSFLSEDSGTRLNIIKENLKWVDYGTSDSHLATWIEQLGEQIESGKYV